ncbi:MAG: hypothetical protein SGARI_001706 [Bacillariaceae sp.]
MYCERLVKLDDPAGELDGPGHDICDMEFLTDCFHYGNSTYGHSGNLPPIKMEGLHLRDFADKPADFVDRLDDSFDIKYPHGIPQAHNRRHIGPTPQIRFGDYIRLMVEIPILPPPFPPIQERFAAEVLSITAFAGTP